MWSVRVHGRRTRGCGQCVCMGVGCVDVVSACAWEEDAWVWSVRVHGSRMRRCGQYMCMGGGLMGVVSVCAWEEDSWVWSVCAHGRGIVDLQALYPGP